MLPDAQIKKCTTLSVLFAMVVFYIVIIVSIILHPGFSMFDPNSSLSQMGNVNDPIGWIFNIGMIITGVLLFSFSLFALMIYWGKTTKYYAMLIFLVASFAYIGFGAFPHGTPQHTPLAQTFFFLASVSMLFWSIVAINEKQLIWGILLILLTLSAYFIYFESEIFGFPFAEFYGGVIISIWSLYIGFWDIKKYRGKINNS